MSSPDIIVTIPAGGSPEQGIAISKIAGCTAGSFARRDMGDSVFKGCAVAKAVHIRRGVTALGAKARARHQHESQRSNLMGHVTSDSDGGL